MLLWMRKKHRWLFWITRRLVNHWETMIVSWEVVHIDLQKGWINWHSLQQQTLPFCPAFLLARLGSNAYQSWWCEVVSHCFVSLIKDTEQFFICLLILYVIEGVSVHFFLIFWWSRYFSVLTLYKFLVRLIFCLLIAYLAIGIESVYVAPWM